MNELIDTNEKLLTTRELADQLKTSPKVIIENARKCLPNKVIENGKTTYWNEAEVTVLIERMKGNNSNQYREIGTVTAAVKVAETTLTPALKIKKAFDLMQEGYEEELAILRAKNREQEQKLVEQAPKVEFYDTVTKSEDTMTMADVAKTLNIPNMGRNKLFAFLRDKGVLRDNNEPYQDYVNSGYFKRVETKRELSNGTVRVDVVTVVFQKGVDFIRNLLKEAGLAPRRVVPLF